MIVATGLACLLPHCQSGPLPVGETPGETTLVDLAGQRISFPADFKGKVVVIHFWTSGCPACVIEMATLESVHREHSGRNVAFCSVNVGDSRGAAERYLRRVEITYTVLLDEESATRRHYRIPGVPAIYVLDRKSVLRFTHFGPVGKAELEKAIGALL
jgi:cytochrome c biogenesis protein CcmG/thiol:disulfide interchange protein DsbE